MHELIILGDEADKTGIYECDIKDINYNYPAIGIFDNDKCIKLMLHIYKLPKPFIMKNMNLFAYNMLIDTIIKAIENINIKLLFAIFTNNFFKKCYYDCKTSKINLLNIAIDTINTKLFNDLNYIITENEYNMIQYIVTMFPNMVKNSQKYPMNLIYRTPHNIDNLVSKLHNSICGEYYWSPLINELINPKLKYPIKILTKYFNEKLLCVDIIENILSKSIIISTFMYKTYTIGDILNISGLNKVSIEDRKKIGVYASKIYQSCGKANVLINHKIISVNTYCKNDAMDIKKWIIDNINKLDTFKF